MTNKTPKKPDLNKTISLGRMNPPDLFKEGFGGGTNSLWMSLIKDDTRKSPEKVSGQSVTTGIKEHPFDFLRVTEFQTSNVHHAACIRAKVNSTVGTGFLPEGELPEDSIKNIDKESKVDKILNALCESSITDLLSDAVEDYYQVGNGFIEVKRAGTKITGLHHIPAWQCRKVVEDLDYNFHYEIVGSLEDTYPRKFAAFGDRDSFIDRMNKEGSGIGKVDENIISEVIHLRQPSSLSRWYGYPSWLAAVASIELTQSLYQWLYDMFFNRGMPDFILFFQGGKMAQEEWETITTAFQNTAGLGNSHKGILHNMVSKDIVVTLEKLAMENNGNEAKIALMKESLAMDIVSAHGVPPLLAGIQIPGKMAANNELPNALMSFQVLEIGPTQRVISGALGKTLGDAALNGGLGLTPDNLRFRRVTDAINLGTADTMSRMKEPLATANAKGRDLGAGLKD